MFAAKRGMIPLPIHKSGGDYQPVLYSLRLGEAYIRHLIGYYWFGDKAFTESKKPIPERMMTEFTGSSRSVTRSQCVSVIYLQILIKSVGIFLFHSNHWRAYFDDGLTTEKTEWSLLCRSSVMPIAFYPTWWMSDKMNCSFGRGGFEWKVMRWHQIDRRTVIFRLH